jgi:hypothetical protein
VLLLLAAEAEAEVWMAVFELFEGRTISMGQRGRSIWELS